MKLATDKEINKEIEKLQASIRFRTVFVSPFFELEVRSKGSNWQTVCSQEKTVTVSVKAADALHPADVESYPILKFRSLQDAAYYAHYRLGIKNMATGSSLFGLVATPPASVMYTRRGGTVTSVVYDNIDNSLITQIRDLTDAAEVETKAKALKPVNDGVRAKVWHDMDLSSVTNISLPTGS